MYHPTHHSSFFKPPTRANKYVSDASSMVNLPFSQVFYGAGLSFRELESTPGTGTPAHETKPAPQGLATHFSKTNLIYIFARHVQ
jgi:hypothetical protein